MTGCPGRSFPNFRLNHLPPKGTGYNEALETKPGGELRLSVHSHNCIEDSAKNTTQHISPLGASEGFTELRERLQAQYTYL